MEALLVVAGIGALLVIGVLAARRRRRSPSVADRFILRVHVRVRSGEEAVRLGTSVEVATPPSSVPTLTAVEVQLEDDADHVVVIPAGTVLRVRDFDGARRLPLEAVTTSEGTGQRWSFDVPPDVRFWILDAPSWHDCMGMAEPDRRALPPRADGYEITTRAAPPPAVDAEGNVSVTMAEVSMPLWMYGLHGPDAWLLGPRPPESETPVAIASFTDPFGSSGKSPRDSIVDAAAFLLVDEVWLRTSGRATAGVPIVIGHARVITREKLRAWERLTTWRRGFGAATVFVWGAAREDVDADGFDVRARAAGDAVDEAFGGPLAAVRAALLDVLERRGSKRVGPATGGLTAPLEPIPEPLVGAYLAIADFLILMILGHKKNKALKTQPVDSQRKLVDLAKELVDLAPEHTVATLLWIVTAIYAYDGGALDAEQRAAVLALVRTRLRGPDNDAVRRLAPAILHRLGEAGEAVTACREALSTLAAAGGYRDLDPVSAAYRVWLDKVEQLARAS